MRTLEEKKQDFLHNVGAICLNSASVVFNDDKDFPIEKIRLGSTVYSNKNKMGERIIEYSHNVQKAINMVRKLNSIKDYGDHIDPFIIKYHPSWAFLREQNGFVQKLPNEIPCLKTPDFRTYEEWIKDNFIALGLNVTPKDTINSKALINDKTLSEIYSEEDHQYFVSSENNNHQDFYAFVRTCYIKAYIDNYRKHVQNGGDVKELDCSYKGVDYTLGNDGFPQITIGSGKNTKRYDFRNPKQLADFYKKMAEKNPGTPYGKTYQKLLKSRKF